MTTAGSCTLSFKATEEDEREIQKLTVESNMNAAVVAVFPRNDWYFNTESKTNNGTGGFSQ